MFRVNGLFGHIQLNNLKTVILIVSFLILAVGGTVGPIQILLHGFGMEKGGAHRAFIEQVVEHPTFSSGSMVRLSPQGGGDFAAPSTEPSGPSAPDEAKLPDINRAGANLLLGSPVVQALWALGFSLVYLVVATWRNSRFIGSATRAAPLRRSENPALYNIVENLALTAGIPCPAIEVIETPQLNAYASGLTPQTARMRFTTGLLAKLSPREVEAVAAHELTHILYRDSRLMAVTKACVDLVVVGPIRYAYNVRRRPTLLLPAVVVIATGAMNPVFYLALLGALAGAVVLAFLCKAMVMQSREFVADAGAIELTKAPEALISALRKVSGHEYEAEGNLFAQAMMIGGPTAGWFSTHPPLEARIAAIREYGGVGAPVETVVTTPRRALLAADQPATGFGNRAAPTAAAMKPVADPPSDFERDDTPYRGATGTFGRRQSVPPGAPRA